MAAEEQVTTPIEEREEVDHDEFTSESKSCPECGEPVDNLRKTCVKCGYEYQAGDYDDTEAGNELRAGTALDEDGNELTEEGEETGDDDESANDAETEEKGS